MSSVPRTRRVLLITVFVLILPMTLRAGSPKYVAGASYFDPGTMGTPLTWSQGIVSYYTDQGDLSSALPNASANAFVADAFSQWTSISTAAISAIAAGQLAEDVNGSNVYQNPDGTVTMPADILPSATGTPIGIVYDLDGSVTNALLGQGAGDASECFYNAVFGWIDNFGKNAYFQHALVVINGNCAQSSGQLTDVKYRLVRVLGRVLGLDWSQVNDNVFTHNPPPTPDDYAGLPVMHAVDPPNCIPITLCYSNPYQPKLDDQAAISRLYPASSMAANTARISGSVYFTNHSGQAAEGMQGVNVVARWIDPGTGQPSRATAAASVSGFLFAGNAGNIITGYNDVTGLPLNRYGSNDTTVEGFYDLGGLPIPNGANSAPYQLTVEAIDPLWSTPLGPYEPLQVEPSGTPSPITVTVSAGASVQQDILMQGSAEAVDDPFSPTTYNTPAALPPGADWMGSLSPYGDLDYFWFSGQVNRTIAVLATALDESGNPTISKAQPVIGIWALSDPGTSPAPANTPMAFNTFTTGLTMLNATLLQTTDFRIGISDFRSDGRPDYRYHARVLYGDAMSPARASVLGGTPLTLQGLGFESNTVVSFGSTNVTPLSAGADQIVINAPAFPDGVVNVTLLDPPTGATSTMTSALTYGAGPNDTIGLIAGSNPGTPAGAQAPNPIVVQVLDADGVTPVQGASVLFGSAPAAAFSACSGGTSCTVVTNLTGQAATYVTPLASGASTITAKLAPASYPSPKQVQTTLVGTSSSLDIGLVPQTAHILTGASASVVLTARVLSYGVPIVGRDVNFAFMKGSGALTASTVATDTNGYASTTLQVSSFSSDVQISACVAPGNAPCQTFYGTAVPAGSILLRPISGTSQMLLVGQQFQIVTVQATDQSTPANPVLGASVVFQSTGGLFPPSGSDNNSEPVIFWSTQTPVISDSNGYASFQPTTYGFTVALEIKGAATAGSSNIPFDLVFMPTSE